MMNEVKKIACPRCGSSNVLSQQNLSIINKIKVKTRGHGFFWWLLFGIFYLIWVLCVWTFKAMYWLFIGWWVDLIKKSKEKKEREKVVHVCQDCGYRWETK